MYHAQCLFKAIIHNLSVHLYKYIVLDILDSFQTPMHKCHNSNNRKCQIQQICASSLTCFIIFTRGRILLYVDISGFCHTTVDPPLYCNKTWICLLGSNFYWISQVTWTHSIRKCRYFKPSSKTPKASQDKRKRWRGVKLNIQVPAFSRTLHFTCPATCFT